MNFEARVAYTDDAWEPVFAGTATQAAVVFANSFEVIDRDIIEVRIQGDTEVFRFAVEPTLSWEARRLDAPT